MNLLAFALPGLFYAATFSHELRLNKPVGVRISDTPLVLYRNASGHVIAHSDICPHQGASFAHAGYLSPQKHLVCGYHGFKFCSGKFLGIPEPATPTSARGFQMPQWDVRESDGIVYVRYPGKLYTQEFLEDIPEMNDPSFRKVAGSRILQQNQQCTTENVIDMLHISYVHKTFGNRDSPLPYEVKHVNLDEFSGKSTFLYRSKPGSLASFLGQAFPEVLVENEFYLPTTTVTRVKTGKYVKTVVTRALPQTFGTTRLFWEVYRNFGCDPLGVGDVVMTHLMERTLDEDVAILRHVDPLHREGPIRTKYDITIRKYRQAIEKYMLFHL